MRISSLAAGFTVGALCGIVTFSIGNPAVQVPEPVTETRFVTVTKPAEVIVHHEDKTEYVTVPLPDSCVFIIDDLSKAVNQMNNWNNGAVDYYDQLENVDLATLDNQQANNQLVIHTSNVLANEENALWQVLSLESNISTGLSSCKADIEAANSSD